MPFSEHHSREYVGLVYITGDVWVSQVALVVKNSPANAGDVRAVTSFSGLKRSPGEGNGTYSNILARRIPWTEEPDKLWSVGSQRVRHD